MLQNEPFLIKYLLTHWTHKVDCDTTRHISFRQHTLFVSDSERSPSPPSSFGLQTLSQDILAFVVHIAGQDHKKDEQS